MMIWSDHRILGVFVMVIALSMSRAVSGAGEHHELLQPAPQWGPEQVIQIVLRSLAQPDEPHDGAGIEQVWAFASPRNRAQTGPLERFRDLVNKPAYRPMLGHRQARPGELTIEDDRAYQEVEIIGPAGTRVVYVFQLGRHATDDCSGCWMTDAVISIEREEAEAI